MSTDHDSHDTAQDEWSLLWRVRLSALYHRKRERFLDGLDRLSKAICAIGGGAAFAQLRSDPDFGMVATGVIAILSTLTLVYGTAAKARKHGELAHDFKRLEASIVAEGTKLTKGQIAKFESRLITLEASEPPQLGALVTHCHNELSTAIGNRGAVTPLPWYQSLFMNWKDFDQSLAANKAGA